MNNHRGGCGRWHCICFILLGLALQVMPSPVQAASGVNLLAPQPAQPDDAPPTIQITHIDNSHLPDIQIAVSGANLPAQLQALPAQIVMDGSPLSIVDDQMEQQGIQLAVAIDTNNLSVRSQAGQTHYARVANVLNRLLSAESIVAGQDWVSCFWLTGSEPLRELQPWTQQADQLFNEFVANRPSELTGVPLTAQPLLDLVNEFALSRADAQMADHVRAILLFSTGQTASDMQDVINAARAQSVRVYVVELLDADAAADSSTSVLQQLALQTGGHHIALTDPESVAPLARRLLAAHDSRVFTVRADTAQQHKLDVSLVLPNGDTLATSVELPTLASAYATPVPANAPAASDASQLTPVSTSAEDAVTVEPAATLAASNAPNAEADPGVASVSEPVLVGDLLVWAVPAALLVGMLIFWLWLRKRRARGSLSGADAVGKMAGDGYLLADETRPTRFQVDLPASPLPNGGRAPNHRPYKSPLVKQRAVRQPASPNGPQISTALPSAVQDAETDFENQQTVFQAAWSEDVDTYQDDDDATDLPVIGRLVRVVSEPRLPQELPICGPQGDSAPEYWIHIGRQQQNNALVINDISISRQHAAIIVRNGQLYLSDNNSASGTFLNWKQLTPGDELLLRDKDLVSFGQIVYEYRTQN